MDEHVETTTSVQNNVVPHHVLNAVVSMLAVIPYRQIDGESHDDEMLDVLRCGSVVVSSAS